MVIMWYIVRNFIMGRQNTAPPEQMYRPSLAKGTPMDIYVYFTEGSNSVDLSSPVWKIKNVAWAQMPEEVTKKIVYHPSKVSLGQANLSNNKGACALFSILACLYLSDGPCCDKGWIVNVYASSQLSHGMVPQTYKCGVLLVQAIQRNGTLFVDAIMVESGYPLEKSDPEFDLDKIFHIRQSMSCL
jgi:hypothetical protein